MRMSSALDQCGERYAVPWRSTTTSLGAPSLPPGLFGGRDGAPNDVVVERQGTAYRSPHWSKDEDIRMSAGDSVHVRTPGGGGYGDPFRRDPELVRRDVARGYFTVEDAGRDYGVALTGQPPAV